MDAYDLRGLLRDMDGQRVLVVGDVILDEYLWGDAARLSAEAPVPVVEVRTRSDAPGGAANVAANLVGLGATVLLAGVVGCDPQAGRLAQALRDRGVNAEGLIDDRAGKTTTKTRLIARGQQIVRIDDEYRQPLSPETEHNLLSLIERHMPTTDAVILSDYGKGVVSAQLAQHVIRATGDAGRPLIVDPKGTNYEKYRGATVIKPNVHEVERVIQAEIRSDADLLHAACRLLGQLDGCAVLITRGGDGMSLFRTGIAPLHMPAVARHVYDTTGAGDTVVAALALLLATGASIEKAVAVANQAAGIAVGKRGTTAVTAAELRQACMAAH